MNEPTRNMLGFMLVSLLIGGAFISPFYFRRKRKPSFWFAFILLILLPLFGFAVFFIAGMLELPCAYFFTTARMSTATSVTGVPVSKILHGKSLEWSTDDYMCDTCGASENLMPLWLETQSRTYKDYFFYDTRTRFIVPITDAAAQDFPEFVPPGDTFVNIAYLEQTNHTGPIWLRYIEGNELKVPTKWFAEASRGETDRCGR
jgi:hypothetical protein